MTDDEAERLFFLPGSVPAWQTPVAGRKLAACGYGAYRLESTFRPDHTVEVITRRSNRMAKKNFEVLGRKWDFMQPVGVAVKS